jgi:hypothetical protein
MICHRERASGLPQTEASVDMTQTQSSSIVHNQFA